MVQQMNDSKFSEYGLGSTETGLPHDKQSPVSVRKTPLRNLQNDNRIVVPKATGNSLFSKERGPIVDENQVSGTKRSSPECPVNPACHRTQGCYNANGHLVYVRRKSEVDLGNVNLLQMVRQMSDSKFSEYGLSSAETSLPSRDKQSPVAVRKAPLRNLQNDNRIMVPKATGNSLFSKERGSENRVGTKRPSPESPVNPACHQSQGSNTANGHLVYVRRKSEVDVGKSSSCDATRNHVDCQDLKQLGPQEETTQPKPEIKDTKISFPAVAPFPVASLANHSSGKPSIPLLSGRSGVRFPPADSSYIPVTNAIPSLDNPTRRINRQWEERSLQLKILLRKLDQSNREDYVQMLRSLSSVELSRHAVDLEKRAIQLALEEGKELERVRLLNVLGKSTRDLKAQSTQ